jgi:ankyrin repeat protein
MLKAAVLKKYQKFWIKRSSLRKNGSLELPVHEEYSTLRLLCESLLSEKDKAAMDEIVMDDLMERTVDSNAEATCTRLVAILKDKTSGFLPNSYLGDGSTPLHVVTKARFSDCVRVLIQHDANVNAVHLQLGHSVLHVAAMVGCYQSMNHLLNAGANRTYVNLLPGRHRSALHYAAERGSAPCLLMLLNPSQGSQVRRNEEVKEVRAVLDLPDAFGNTALHLACVDGSEECVRILIEVLFTHCTVLNF